MIIFFYIWTNIKVFLIFSIISIDSTKPLEWENIFMDLFDNDDIIVTNDMLIGLESSVNKV